MQYALLCMDLSKSLNLMEKTNNTFSKHENDL